MFDQAARASFTYKFNEILNRVSWAEMAADAANKIAEIAAKFTAGVKNGT